MKWDIELTNRFQVPGRLFSDRSHMTSKCSKNKKRSTQAAGECVNDVLLSYVIKRQTMPMMTSSMRLPSKRSLVRSNQNACRI